MAFVWRWRRNPLRRRSDVLEAWAGVAAVVLVLMTAPVVGWVTGTAAHQALRETVREQHLHRHLVTATTVRAVHGGAEGAGLDTGAGREGYHRVVARWPGPDGRERTGAVAARQPAVPGRRFPLWTDDLGRVAPRPLDDATATVHAVLAGAGAAAATAALVEGARRLVVWRLARRRFAQWDRAWERAGHTWGRADAGS
ncbi:Rv1733c family protein [Streptomyces griseocarneus]|uniref:Rv1733c family protein n=1 Tax=Streptomyces griseocarneus TaxID=51201 RepID=UPI00167C8721|nr:hypothetical protein [Streptomyces griseocarneus]MBZ6476281.1 hypothetical protein [Streptomyces griseocarneus]